MKTHFYFDFLDKSIPWGTRRTMPARLVAHDIEDDSFPQDALIDCEISTNDKWGILGNWQRAKSHNCTEMLREALQKLADQEYEAKRALTQMHCNEDDFLSVKVGPYGAFVNFRPYDIVRVMKGGIIRQWYVHTFTHWNSDTSQSHEVGLEKLDEYQHFLRGAVITLLKSQAELRRVVGLKPTAPFDSVVIRLQKIGEQYAGGVYALERSNVKATLNRTEAP